MNGCALRGSLGTSGYLFSDYRLTKAGGGVIIKSYKSEEVVLWKKTR